MHLTTRLDRERYHWVTSDPSDSRYAVLTITVTANPGPADATLRLQVGSAMRSARVAGGPEVGGGSTVNVDLGALEAGESREVVVRFSPARITRAGRRRVAVVQLVATGDVIASTTVWARVERHP